MVNKRIIYSIMSLLMILSLVMLGSFTGCQQTAAETTAAETAAAETTAAKTEAASSGKVVYITLGQECPYCGPFNDTLEAGAKEKGIDLVLLDPGLDVQTQVDQLNEAISLKPDLIGLFALDSVATGPATKTAFEAGIAVLYDHSKADKQYEDYTIGYTGPDTYLEGVYAAELMNDKLGGKGNVLIIEGIQGMDYQINRTKGFEDRLKELNSEIVILAKQTGGTDKATATAIMEDYLVRYPDFDGVFGHDDTLCIGAWVAMEEAGIAAGEKILVGVGASKEGLKGIDEGYQYATVSQIPTDGASFAIDIIAKTLSLGVKPPEKLDPFYNIMPLPKITKENVADYLPGVW